MSLAPGTYRLLMLAAAVVFGVFLLVAATFRILDASQDTLGVVAGGFAYGFIAIAAGIVLRGWLGRAGGADATARRYVEGHPGVAASVGRPVSVGEPVGEVPRGAGAAQANLVVPVSGPVDAGQVDVVMARLARRWEVLSATLVVDGDRVPLAGGPADTAAE